MGDDVAEGASPHRCPRRLRPGRRAPRSVRHGRHVVVGRRLEVRRGDAGPRKGRDRRLDDARQIDAEPGAPRTKACRRRSPRRRARLEQGGRRAHELATDFATGVDDRAARGHRAAARERPDAERHGGGCRPDHGHPVGGTPARRPRPGRSSSRALAGVDGPVATTTRPARSSFTVAPSNGPIGALDVAGDPDAR